MVLSIIIALNAAPALLGTQEAIRQSQSQDKREEHRARRCNLVTQCTKASSRSAEINGRRIVLANNKLYIDPGSDSLIGDAHPFAGYYLPYPDEQYEGLVSTITDEAPVLNWIYVDCATYEVKYGIRVDAQSNFHGPWDCTRQDRRLTFESWEGFCAVEDSPGVWAVYFDRDDNGLLGKVPQGARVLEIELTRVEKRWKKDPIVRQREQGTLHSAEETEQVSSSQHNTSVVEPTQAPENISNDVRPEMVALPQSPKPETKLSGKVQFWESLSPKAASRRGRE